MNSLSLATSKVGTLTYDGGRQYFLLRVTQIPEHGPRDVLWTAPIWFEQPPAPPPSGPAAPDPDTRGRPRGRTPLGRARAQEHNVPNQN